MGNFTAFINEYFLEIGFWSVGFIIILFFLNHFATKRTFKRGVTQAEIAHQEANKNMHVTVLLIFMIIWLLMAYQMFIRPISSGGI